MIIDNQYFKRRILVMRIQEKKRAPTKGWAGLIILAMILLPAGSFARPRSFSPPVSPSQFKTKVNPEVLKKGPPGTTTAPIRAEVTGFTIKYDNRDITVYVKNKGSSTIPKNTLGIRIYQQRADGTGAISNEEKIDKDIAPGSTQSVRLWKWVLSCQTRKIKIFLTRLSDHKTIYTYSKPYKAYDVSIEQLSWNNSTREWTLKIKNNMDLPCTVYYYVNDTNNYVYAQDWADKPTIPAHGTLTVTKQPQYQFHYWANGDGSTRIDRITATLYIEDYTYSNDKSCTLDKKEIEIPCVPNSQGLCQ
jgi:hypothetical protein